jgi:hypothetical protein
MANAAYVAHRHKPSPWLSRLSHPIYMDEVDFAPHRGFGHKPRARGVATSSASPLVIPGHFSLNPRTVAHQHNVIGIRAASTAPSTSEPGGDRHQALR